MNNFDVSTRFNTAKRDSFRNRGNTRRPASPDPTETSPQEAILNAANTGQIDVGQEGEGVTPEQALNRATVRQAAQDFLPQFMEDKRQEYKQVAKEMSDMPRLLSASNRFIRTLGRYVGEGALKTQAVLKSGLHNFVTNPDNPISASQMPEYLAAQEIGEALEEIFPESPAYREDFWTGTMAGAAGTIAPNVIVGVATAGFGTWATLGASALVNASISGEFYDEAIAEGASEEEAFGFTMLNMAGTAATESIPTALFAKRIDQATGGGLKKLLSRGFKGSLEEGSTEAIQELITNASAQEIFGSTRDIMDGVYESFGAGAILGSAVNATLPALMKRAQTAETANELADTYAALEQAAEVSEALPGETSATRNDVNDFLNRYVPQNESLGEVEDGVAEGDNGAGVTNIEINRKSKEFRLSKKKWKKFWTKYLSSGGLKGQEITEREGQLHARIMRQVEEAHINFSRLNRSVLDHFSSKKNSMYEAVNDESDPTDPRILSQIDQAMRGRTEISSLPEAIQEPVKRSREHIDRLSKEFVKAGLAQGDMTVSIFKGLGSYMHRSYKQFDQNVEWGEEHVPDDVWRSAVAFIRNRRLSYYRKTHEGEPTNKQLQEMALASERDVRKILRSSDISSVQRLFKNKRITNNKADRSVLMERKNVPKPIRELLGEYKDSGVNYLNTINEMAQLIEKRRYFDEIAEMGRGTLFFTENQMLSNDFEGNPDHYVGGLLDETGSLLSTKPAKRPDGSKPKKLFMHKDLYEALTFEAGNNDIPGWLVPLLRLTNIAKISKTALSHVTHARNLVGGMGFLNANGLYFTHGKEIADAWRSATTVFRSYEGLTKKGVEEKWLRYVNLDLTGDSVRGDEILGLMKDLDWSPGGFIESFTHLGQDAQKKGVLGSMTNLFKKGTRGLIQLYRTEDTLIRVWAFELELARMKAADPSITEQEVANMVNNIYPNYSRVNEFIKKARVNPVLAPFISFPAEFIRTQFHAVRYGLEQSKSSNPDMKKIGYKRLAGTFTNYAGVAAVGAASQALSRIDDEEDDAFRQFMPPWDSNSVVAYTDASRGVVRYVNTSYTMPNAYLTDPLFSLIKGDNDRTVMNRFVDASMELFSPLLSEELIWKAGTEIRSNQKSGGGEVWNPEDPLEDKLQKGFLHFWQAVEPGSVSSIQRAIEPVVDSRSDKKVSDELLGLFGLRISSIDIPESYGFRLRELRQRVRNARRVYNSVKYRETASNSEKRDAFERSNERYRDIFREMSQITDAAQTTGVSWRELEGIMEDSGLAQRDIKALRGGVFQPFDR